MVPGDNERGAALIMAVLIIIVLSMLGTVSLTLATHEIEGVKAVREEAAARHLAEAGADVIMSWFHAPSSLGSDPARSGMAELFRPRFELPETGPSFFDASGTSQFTGAPNAPDLLVDASRPGDDRLMNDPATGWFRALHALGRVLSVKVYRPTVPGLLCTVEVTAQAGGVTRTISLQLGARPLLPVRAAVQAGALGLEHAQAVPGPLPVLAHWGTVKWSGNVRLGSLPAIPVKTGLAPVTGQAYSEMSRREDRWLEFWVGGLAFVDPSPFGPVEPPSNVHSRQDPLPGLNQDRWDYEHLKQQALLFGTYYARGADGLLYRNGTVQPGQGLSADEAVRSAAIGDNHGLVFVDTLDGQPPSPTNLGTVTLEPDYMEGLFFVNAHVHVRPRGTGQAVPALSPPAEGQRSPATRIPVQLSQVHLNGMLYTTGTVQSDEPFRIYGALIAEGGISPLNPSKTSSPIEVWYTYELREGLLRGLPLVYVAPGTWSER
jgi:hypothetical protein